MEAMTMKQARFTKNLIYGMKKGEAALAAGYSPKVASVQATQNLKNHKIIAALNRAGLTDTAMAELLKHNIVAGSGIKATADTSIRGLALAAQLKGYTTTDKDTTNNNNTTTIYIQELKMLSTDQLQAKLQSLQQETSNR